MDELRIEVDELDAGDDTSMLESAEKIVVNNWRKYHVLPRLGDFIVVGHRSFTVEGVSWSEDFFRIAVKKL